MGLFNWIFGSISPQDVAAPIKAVGDLYTTDKARLEAEKDVINAAAQITIPQIENNRVMLQSSNRFEVFSQSLTYFTIGACLALYWVPRLILSTYIWGVLCLEQHKVLAYPIDPNDIMQLVYLVFGGSGLFLLKRLIK